MSRPRKIRHHERRLADADPTGNRAQRRAAQGDDRYGVPRCPVDGQWCSTCRIGKGNGTGGSCARLDTTARETDLQPTLGRCHAPSTAAEPDPNRPHTA